MPETPKWADVPESDEIVVAGISGRFPESDHMDEFADNLYAKKDMITEDDRRWRAGQWHCNLFLSSFNQKLL